jgi:hypothetical protein
MRRVVLVFLVLGTLASIAAAAGRPTFYLAVASHQCVIAPVVHKQLLVVPCSDAKHNEEVYAVGHATMPPTYAAQLSVARIFCLASFQRVTGRPMGSTEGWEAYWPDPGAERAKYDDKVICAYRHLTRLEPFGPGWHVR